MMRSPVDLADQAVDAFLGPTLAAETAREIAHDVGIRMELHPPARCGDLLRLLEKRERPPVALLIDGVYEREPALWHKEILSVLGGGGRVIGCSSMGALRAVECEPWGAEPIGDVAREYVEGTRTSDADVAVAHAGEEDGYRKLSVPLVDVDAVVAEARARELVDSATAASISQSARELFYAVRTWGALFSGVSDVHARRIRTELLCRPGRKERDARVAIRELPRILRRPRRNTWDPATVPATQLLEALRAEMRAHELEIEYGPLAESPRWPDLLRAGLVRAVIADGRIPGLPCPQDGDGLAALAEHMGIEPSEVCSRLAEAWCTTPAHVRRVGREQIRLTALWALYGDSARRHVVDHMRITGEYTTAAHDKEALS